MPKIKVIQDWGDPLFEVGKVEDMTNPWKLIEEGKVELYVEPKKADSDDSDGETAGPKSSKKKSK